MTDLRAAASLALDDYVKSQRQDGESEAMVYDRLVKSRDVNLTTLYAVSQGRGLATSKAQSGSALDVAIEDRVQKLRRDDETFETALARCAKEDVVIQGIYRIAHG